VAELDDISVRLSTKSGSAGDSLPSSPADSLGKYLSTTPLSDGGLHNLFDAVSGVEAAAGDVEYRCLFVLNEAADSMLSVKVWIESQVAGGADIALGLDPAGASDRGDSSAQAATIADESAAPSGVTFSLPTGEGSALSVGDVAADECFAIWVRRTVPVDANPQADGASLHVGWTR
jgi:hypothetical protein